MKRDGRIDLFRCACMAGVVLLHSLTQGGYADSHRGLDNLMTPSVVGFVFISGYFGITFRWNGVLKLLGVGVASFMTLVVASGDFRSSFGITGYWWFLWMYLVLMAFAPVVNALFDENNLGGRVMCKLVPLLLVVYIWSYAATTIPVLKTVLPKVQGFSSFGVLTFIATYVFARASKLFEEKIRTKWLLLVAVVSGVFCWIGFYHYSSPFALMFAGAMFYLFKRLPQHRIIDVLGRIAFILAPSMFPIYLLHTNVLGFEMLRMMEDYLISLGWNYYLMVFLVAAIIFSSCIVLDVPRRLVVGLLRKHKFWQWMSWLIVIA